MKPVYEPIYIKRGDTYQKIVEGVLADLAPLNVNDWTVRAHYRTNYDATSFVPFSVALSTIETNTVLRVELELTDTQTSALTQNGVWDLEVAYPNGTVITWLEGPAYVTKDVTR